MRTIPVSDVAPAPPSEKNARAICYEALARGSRSFWLASLVLPPGLRADAAALYAWCRRCDDAIDGAADGAAAAALATLQSELDAVYGLATPDDATLAAFQEVVRERRIPIEYPRELLYGMAMDVNQTHYATMQELLLYCYRVAGVVGLMMCHVFGVSDIRALRRAAHMGIAMQLTNICRDVAEDWRLGRLYIPDEVLHDARAGTLADALGSPLLSSARVPLAAAVRHLLGEAERFYASGDLGVPELPFRAGVATHAARLVYSAIGHRVKDWHCDIFKGRAIVPVEIQLRLIFKAIYERVYEMPREILNVHWPAPVTRTLAFPDDVLPLDN
jgi:phytoene synthase